MNYDLLQIKKYYGENMMHLCRSLFPTILEVHGKLFQILKDNFNYSKYLYKDIVDYSLENEFRDFIFKLFDDIEKNELEVDKTPYELLDEAGYILYECNTYEDIQAFKKYYCEGEELCTFNDNRLNRCHVFFAVKKNVEEIKREDYIKPDRQDEYGTSVISIQFTKGVGNSLSIKNRYNHKVVNPDATFSNDLENIIFGLTKSFERYYGLNINRKRSATFEIPNYVLAKDGKFYKYNAEINGIYYCHDNIIIDEFEVVDTYLKKEEFLVIDYFVIDLVRKEIFQYNSWVKDSFVDCFMDDIEKIEIRKDKDSGNKIIKVICSDNKISYIGIDNLNRIISYKNDYTEIIYNDFLSSCQFLEEVELLNAKEIRNNFLYDSVNLKRVCLPNVVEVWNNFLFLNTELEEVDMPKLVSVRSSFCRINQRVKKINFLELVSIGNYFFSDNKIIDEVFLPKAMYIGNYFLENNLALLSLKLPNVVTIGNCFMFYNEIMHSISIPKVDYIGDDFMHANISVVILKLDNLEFVGHNFMKNNEQIKIIFASKLESVGRDFLRDNNTLIILYAPKLTEVGINFLPYNNSLFEYVCPYLENKEKESVKKLFKSKGLFK